MASDKEVKYLGRDYASLKEQLKDFLKIYFPNDHTDFSENSSSMAILEMAAYVGEVLSFYQDRNFNEVLLERTSEFKNAASISKNYGWKPRGPKPSYGKADITATFSSTADRSTYGFILKKGTQLSSNTNIPTVYETLYDVDFTSDDDKTIATLSAGKYYVTKKNVDIVSGTTKTFTTYVSAPQSFLKITIPDKNIFNIESITDSNSNSYYEVGSLSQDTIMTSTPNYSSSSGDNPYNLILKYVPRRFITSLDGEGYTNITFGSGINNVSEFDFLPAPEDYTINQSLLGKNDIAFDNISAENFLTTNSLGLAPSNTTLNIKYIKGGGKDTVVGVGNINKILKSIYTAKNSIYQNSDSMNRIISQLTVYNSAETSGGDDADKISDIQYIAPKYFSAQGRAVALQDFVVAARSMPSKYGSIFRCSAKVDSTQNNTVNLYVLTKTESNNINNFQIANQNIKENLQSYISKYRCFNDVITIKDAKIIDIGINFSIRIDYSTVINPQEILANVMISLKNSFDIQNWDIEQPIYIAKIANTITNVKGVLAVGNIEVVKKSNGFDNRVYNEYEEELIIKNGKVVCPPDSVFQVRYPFFDITGSFILD